MTHKCVLDYPVHSSFYPQVFFTSVCQREKEREKRKRKRKPEKKSTYIEREENKSKVWWWKKIDSKKVKKMYLYQILYLYTHMWSSCTRVYNIN